MLRLMADNIKPGMKLARDICTVDGRTILVAGVIITEKQIDVLRKWQINSIYVTNPILEIPEVGEAIQEKTRKKVAKAIEKIFDSAENTRLYSLDGEQRALVKSIIEDVVGSKLVLVHLAQISRHQDDGLTHAVNVAILSTITAMAMSDYNRDNLYVLAIGALLHDIGKIFVPKDLFKKEDPTVEDLEIIRNHTNYGFEVLRRLENFSLVAAHIALQHHENHNGSGFPDKKKGEEIHLFARIVAIADRFDNLVAGGLKMHTAYEAIATGNEIFFDPKITEAFLSRIAVYPVGTFVRITEGNIGIITQVVPKMQHRPKVRVIADKNNQLYAEAYEINLASQTYLTYFIEEILSEEETVALLQQNKLFA